MEVKMITGIAIGILTGIMSNLSYDLLFHEDEISEKTKEAYENAKKRFYKKYDSEYGDELNSFLERQQNIDSIVKSLFFSEKKLTIEDIDARSFNASNNATQNAVIDFINFFHEEVHKDFLLDRILTEKEFMDKSTRNQNEIIEEITKNTKGIEGLKRFFVETLNNSFNKFKGTIAFDIALSNQTLNMGSMEPPNLINNGVNRQDNVNFIMKEINEKTWLHLKGDVGSGKTQFLLLLSQMFKGQHVWINLKDYSNEQSIPIINTTLASFTKTKPSNSSYSWYEKAISKLNKNDIIVIDDLPNLILNNSISDLVVKLVSECQIKGIKILSSGSYGIGLKIKQQLENDFIKSTMIPIFNENEIEELLHLKGAPKIEVKKLSTWIGVIAKNNPSIVNTIADYLSFKNWDISGDVFEKINNGHHLDELMSEIQNILIDNIADEDTKQLLYRLTIINNEFNNHYVREISQIEPVIKNPYEKMNNLLGNWITKNGQSYTVSPLVSKFGELNLDENIKCLIHLKIVKLIVEKEILTPLEIMNLIVHLISAKEFNEAARALLNALNELEEHGIEKDYWGLTLIWNEMPIPNEIDYDLKLMLRTKQFIVRNKLGESVEYILKDLDELIFNTKYKTCSDSTKTFATFLLTIHSLDSHVLNSIKYLKEALKIYDPKIFDQSGISIFPEEIIWFTAIKIKNSTQLIEWINMLDSLTAEQFERARRSEIFKECCLVLANNIWLHEHKKEKVERKWDKVLLQLQELEQLAERKDIQLLKVSARRSRMVVLGEYLQKLDEAEALCSDILETQTLTEEEEFLIISMMGKQLFLQKEYEKAKVYFERAINIDCESFQMERVDALMELSQCKGLSNNSLASNLVKDALNIIEKEEYFHDIQFANVLGEYSVSLWLEGKFEEAFYPLEKATEILLKSDISSPMEKRTGLILGHVAGYYSSIARSGQPPEKVIGGEVYVAPFRGIFLGENTDFGGLFNRRKFAHLTTILFKYAESIGNQQSAKRWLYKGYEMIRELGIKNSMASVHLLHLTTYLILDEKFDEAVDVSFMAFELIHCGAIMNSVNETDFILEDIDVEKTLTLNEELKNVIYLDAVRSSIVPIMVYICTISLNAKKTAEDLVVKAIKVTDKYREDEEYTELWNGLRDMFHSISYPENNVIQIYKKYEALNEFHKSILQGVSYIVSTLNCEPKQALHFQHNFIVWLDNIFRNDSFGKEKILKVYFTEYWIKSYVKDRDQFNNTHIIDEEFKNALKSEGSDIIKDILKVINIGFNLPINPDVQSYLYQK